MNDILFEEAAVVVVMMIKASSCVNRLACEEMVLLFSTIQRIESCDENVLFAGCHERTSPFLVCLNFSEWVQIGQTRLTHPHEYRYVQCTDGGLHIRD